MSRSFKKHPGFVVKGKRGRYHQKMASRRVRRTHDVPDGCSYKRCYPTWDIIDQREIYSSRQEAKRQLAGIFKDDEMHRAWTK